DLAEDHEGGRPVAPALVDVGAARLLADGVEPEAAHQSPDLLVVRPGLQPDPDPRGLRPRRRRRRGPAHGATPASGAATRGPLRRAAATRSDSECAGAAPTVMSRPKRVPNSATSGSTTSAKVTGRPRRRAIDVTPRARMPHGTIRPKWERSVVTLSAK